MHAKYLPLVDRVSDRAELSDLISEMVGELSTLHIFVRFGDQRDGPDQISRPHWARGWCATKPPAAGAWTTFIGPIRIIRTQFAPLAPPGVEVGEGDVITAINGRPTR